MGRKINIVTVPSTDVEMEGFVANKREIETGCKRTLFFVFKSYDITVTELARFKKNLESVMAPEDGTEIVMLAIAPGDDFEIRELDE